MEPITLAYIVVNIFCVRAGIEVRLIPIRIPWCAKKITDRRIKKALDKDALSNNLPARAEYINERNWRALVDVEVDKKFNYENFKSLEAKSSTDPKFIATLKASSPEVSRLNPPIS